MKKLTPFLILFLLTGLARPVDAHTDLVQADPSPGAQLAESPSEIRLTFSEPVASDSRIELFTDEFQRIDGLVTQYNPAQPEQVYSPVPPLEPGVYTVQWAAVSSDGHEISGSYSFSVGMEAGGTNGAETTTPSSDEDEPVAETTGVSRSSWWLAALGLVAVGLPLILVLLRKSGRR